MSYQECYILLAFASIFSCFFPVSFLCFFCFSSLYNVIFGFELVFFRFSNFVQRFFNNFDEKHKGTAGIISFWDRIICFLTRKFAKPEELYVF